VSNRCVLEKSFQPPRSVSRKLESKSAKRKLRAKGFYFMVRGFARAVKLAAALKLRQETTRKVAGASNPRSEACRGAISGLLLLGKRFANIAHKPRMSRSAELKIPPGLAQAEFAIHSGSHFIGVLRVLAVIFPPANRTKFHGVR
jgi:hypothetical protein